MQSSKIIYTLLFTLIISLLFSACKPNIKISYIEQAKNIRLSINDNNVEYFHSLVSSTLIVREQQWETAKDGIGFILGEVKQVLIQSDAKTASFLKSIYIEGDKAISDVTLNMFHNELGAQIKRWEKYKLILFIRGEGDVEHIVLMGLDNKTRKLQALYVN